MTRSRAPAIASRYGSEASAPGATPAGAGPPASSGGRSSTRTTSPAATATAAGVGARCRGIAVTPDGRKLSVADGAFGDVAVLDAASLSVVRRIPAGALPCGVAIGPPGGAPVSP